MILKIFDRKCTSVWTFVKKKAAKGGKFYVLNLILYLIFCFCYTGSNSTNPSLLEGNATTDGDHITTTDGIVTVVDTVIYHYFQK